MIEAPPTAPPPPSPASRPPTSRADRALRSAIEWVVIIAAALLVAFLVKTFLIQAFFIPSASMEPQLRNGDRIFVNKLSYRLHDIHRGDVVVFERPACAVPDPRIKDLVKRVVGLPGDVVEGKTGAVFVNGQRLVEKYLPEGQTTSDFGPVTVPAGKLWIMGDNRENSTDSRVLCSNAPTFIDQDSVVGRAFVKVYPLNDLQLL
ncbi:MAG: signal peptidase I [Actinomycetota bacterium]|nr:signal peptidase I [Actinomycetota bacterium]